LLPSLADVEDFYAQCDPGELRSGAAPLDPDAITSLFRASFGVIDLGWGWCGGWAEKENLCLYGYANEAWEVALPAEEVPTELPEPALGINFARDGMNRRDWLALVAVHSDSWLLSVAFYYAARLNRNDRYAAPDQSPLPYFSHLRVSVGIWCCLSDLVMEILEA
jgi:hypothetical protein